MPANKTGKNDITAKVAQRNGVAKEGKYICQKCGAQFAFAKGMLQCPRCQTTVADNLVPFYTEEDSGVPMQDFHAGD